MVPKNTEIILLNIPKRLRARFSTAVTQALEVLSWAGVAKIKPITVVVVYDPTYPLGDRAIVHGYPLENRDHVTVIIHLGILLFRQRSEVFMAKSVAAGVVHELVHVMRKGIDLLNLRGSIIEEGLATYISSNLAMLPIDIKLDDLNLKQMLKIWRSYKPHLSKKAKLDSYSALPKGIYSLGLFVVDQFIRNNPEFTFGELLRMPGRKLTRFMDTLFAA